MPDSARAAPFRYEQIGHGYARMRREDPRIARVIHAALGDARTVINIGAGAGSYEPRDRHVIAIEPSDVMSAQRPAELPPAVRAAAGDLPLRDQSVDAAMAVLTVHHWDGQQASGVREMRRVARDAVVIVTFDAEVSSRWWLTAEYLPEVADLDRRIMPSAAALADWLGGSTRVETIPIPRDTPDWTLASFWAHPERVLDERARNATSGFARMDGAVIDRVVRTLSRDLRTGAWDRRHGHLRGLEAFDAGMRLIVNAPG